MQKEKVSFDNVVKDLLRPELYDILQKAETIQRFENLGLSLKVIQGENVKAHTLRLLSKVDELPISEEIKNACKKTLAIHDLPEVKQLIETGKTADVTAPEKALKLNLDKQVEKSEEEMARIIFDDNELKLYLDFSNASNFLKNRDQKIPTEVGLICKFLDKNDADLHYHEMVINDGDNWKKLNEKGQSLAFEQYVSFSQRLDILKGTELAEAAKLSQDLLNRTMLSIKEIWKEISFEKMPPLIQKNLANFQIHK